MDHQRLIYKGKQLNNENSLFDYSVNLNEVIQLWKMAPPPPDKDKETDKSEDNSEDEKDSEEIEPEPEKTKKCVVIEERTESEYYKCGDIVDIRDTDDSDTAGAYFEAEIVRITVEEGEDRVAGCDDLTYYCKYDAYDGDDYRVKFEQIRPRAREIIKPRGLEEKTEVLVNYNLQDPSSRGQWFRGVVEKVKPSILVTLYVGVDETPVEECKILFPDEVFRLEYPVKVVDRDEKMDRIMNTPVARKHPPKCDHCLDNERKKCKECGCSKCGGKNDPDTILVCDECQLGFHLKCLKMKTIPEDDEWFCPDCKNEDDIVKAGEKQEDGKKKKKMASKANPQSTRDWGKGMATVGRTTECTIVSKDHRGPIPGNIT